jgi:hypothetical protein
MDGYYWFGGTAKHLVVRASPPALQIVSNSSTSDIVGECSVAHARYETFISLKRSVGGLGPIRLRAFPFFCVSFVPVRDIQTMSSLFTFFFSSLDFFSYFHVVAHLVCTCFFSFSLFSRFVPRFLVIFFFEFCKFCSWIFVTFILGFFKFLFLDFSNFSSQNFVIFVLRFL